MVCELINANIFLIKDSLDWVINERALKYGQGIHPKHKLTNYHHFFIDRISISVFTVS